MSKSSNHMTQRVLAFLAVVVAALAAASVIEYLAVLGIVPESYVVPIYAVIILLGGYAVIRIVNSVLERVVEPAFGATRAHGVKNVFELVAGIILIVFVFATFGVNITAALIGAGFIGIVLGLAAQQVLGNIFAGLSLLISKPFEIGDRIRLATTSYSLTGSTYSHESEASGFTGLVSDVGIFFTRVLLDDGTPAIFPNSAVIGALILNYSKIETRTIRVRMDVDKKTDYDKFKTTLIESLKKHDAIERSTIEIMDVGASTFQVVISVSAKGDLDSIRTLVIREGMKAQESSI